MTNFITKAVANSTANYTWEIYFDSAVTDKNGKIITPIIMLDSSGGISIYRIGFVFSSETQPAKTVKILDYINSFTGYTNAYVGSNRRTDGDSVFKQGNTSPHYIYYNSDLKKGVFIFNFTMTSGNKASCNDFAFDMYRMENAIPYLGKYTGDPTRDVSFWENVKNIPAPKSPYELDVSTTGGGDGDYDDNESDTIGLPDLTALNQNSISNTKFLTCYKMTPAQLSKLGDELWSDNIFTQISNTVLKPTDFIVNLSLLPVDVGGVTKLIKAGKILLNGAEGTLISQQFIRVDCGTLEVKKKWGGAIDYQTDVSIFLPFIGEQSLNANEVIGATLNVIYTVDILSGSCIASVRVIKDNLDAVLYQFTGNMASNYPITSADYATVFSGALQLAVGVGSLPSSGGVLSLVSATSNMLSGADVKRTGSLSSASGFMGIKKPYLILSRPVQSLAESYNHFNGFVSNIKMKLGDCNGFTKVDMVHLEAIPCMDEEKAEIESLLKSGVLIN